MSAAAAMDGVNAPSAARRARTDPAGLAATAAGCQQSGKAAPARNSSAGVFEPGGGGEGSGGGASAPVSRQYPRPRTAPPVEGMVPVTEGRRTLVYGVSRDPVGDILIYFRNIFIIYLYNIIYILYIFPLYIYMDILIYMHIMPVCFI